MVSYIEPTLSIFQNNNISEVKNCFEIRRYTFNDKHYALIQIEIIDKRRPDILIWFTVDISVDCGISVVSHYITIADGKSVPKLYKLEWGDKKAIETIINENIM